eukprot:CAMPEP_0197076560 /NCGR_PEP_ID=MMETSP1384-20130603/212180_1 /TAXON_ID=29189 /ORGANISM="Ammonia sp." /LENGTH=944 /DNA_ID=CAMNT_0042515419 /DNA_START=29 /DNA_END=2863 /DNA_ORIENTATION=-
MAEEHEESHLFEGDFIIAQSEVIFFKQKASAAKKKKKKEPKKQRCILLITRESVALTNPAQDHKPVVKFPRNTISDMIFNQNEESHFKEYKIRLTVNIGNGQYWICLEFPTEDAEQQRSKFIVHFQEIIAQNKQQQNNNNSTPSQSAPSASIRDAQNTNQSASNQGIDNQHAVTHQSQPASGTQANNAANQSSDRRGTKRKHHQQAHHHAMDEETLRKRACKLAKHQYLATLYKTLVGKKVLTPQEFWDEYGKDIDAKQTSTGLIQGMSNNVLKTTAEHRTWSLFALFREEVENQNNNNNNSGDDDANRSGKNKLSITLTREKILEIFVHLPEVQLAYEKNVPFNFSEEEFWRAFLQSHYFKRKTAKSVISGMSEKETAMDKLLKQYTGQLAVEQQRNRALHDGSPSPGLLRNYRDHEMAVEGHSNEDNNYNSFAKQLSAIQTAKNKEVDVEGKLQKMRDEIAEARAQRNGEVLDVNMNINDGDGNKNSHNGEAANGHSEKNGDGGDIEMKEKKNRTAHDDNDDDDDGGRIEGNRPLKRRHLKRKLKTLDPSVDLSKTVDSFVEVIEDPGNDQNNNLNRADVQSWFEQMNKHQTMLLYQSLNQQNKHQATKEKQHHHHHKHHHRQEDERGDLQEIMATVPKVNYGRKCVQTDEELNEEAAANGADRDVTMLEKNMDRLNVMNMDYEQRLNVETELEDLNEESNENYIELKIKDQSVYWGDNLLLNESEMQHMHQVANALHEYYLKVRKSESKKKLCEQEVKNVIHRQYVTGTLIANTRNNAATGKASLASERQQEQRHNPNAENSSKNKPQLMIYTQDGPIPAKPAVLKNFVTFQKHLKELGRHYWHCFPANPQRWNKAKILVGHIEKNREELTKFQAQVAKSKNVKTAAQRILCQELIDFADKIIEHKEKLEAEYKEKKEKLKQMPVDDQAAQEKQDNDVEMK